MTTISTQFDSPETGLMAVGLSGRWSLVVDEAIDREEWFLQIDWPGGYLYFELPDLSVIPQLLRFLESGFASRNDAPRTGQDSLSLGRFGIESVSLRWDNEDAPRCFLVIGASTSSTLHLNLYAEDIEMLIVALRQLVDDLPAPVVVGQAASLPK